MWDFFEFCDITFYDYDFCFIIFHILKNYEDILEKSNGLYKTLFASDFVTHAPFWFHNLTIWKLNCLEQFIVI